MALRNAEDRASAVDIDQAIAVAVDRLGRHRAEQTRALDDAQWKTAKDLEPAIRTERDWIDTLKAYQADRLSSAPAPAAAWHAVHAELLGEYERLRQHAIGTIGRDLQDHTIAAAQAAFHAWRTLEAFRADALNATANRVTFAKMPTRTPDDPAIGEWVLRPDQEPIDRRRWVHLI